MVWVWFDTSQHSPWIFKKEPYWLMQAHRQHHCTCMLGGEACALLIHSWDRMGEVSKCWSMVTQKLPRVQGLPSSPAWCCAASHGNSRPQQDPSLGTFPRVTQGQGNHNFLFQEAGRSFLFLSFLYFLFYFILFFSLLFIFTFILLCQY